MGSNLSSMTGYGSTTTGVHGWRMRVECRSVNHKGLDVRIYVPGELRWLEPHILQSIKERVYRGRLEVRVDLEPGGAGDEKVEFDQIDERRFQAVARKLAELAHAHTLDVPVTLGDVLTYKNFFERSTGEVFAEDQNAAAILPCLEEALDAMVRSRRTEGEGIGRDLNGYLAELTTGLDKIEALREEDRSALRSRIEERLVQALREFDAGEIDQTRVAQELAFYVEKGDISEEMQRARSHVLRLEAVINDAADKAVGKKIDFYLQELIRETNTMGSKSQFAGLTDVVIDMKSIIEKMREQAANIE